MSTTSNHGHLSTDQYRDGSNLNARVQLHARFSTSKYGWHRWVFDRLDLLPESRILELGCGAGHLWAENLNRIPGDWGVMLSDLSLGMLQEAQRNLSNCQRDFQFAVIDAQAIPYPDESFDAVIANHMLYHVPERMKALAEIRRVLRPGGRLYTSTVGRAHLRELWEWVSRFDPGAELWAGRVTESFVLENGFDQLSQLFSQVTMHRYDDDLLITEVEPLIAYVLSTSAKSALTGDKLPGFVHFMEQELTSHGAIYVTKDSGIFACIRP
jgi:ubiquinone/menaquinone biosynthesis C-methylase UbiE